MPKKNTVQALQHWQPRSDKGKPFPLSGLDPAATPFSTGDKDQDKLAVEELASEINELQDMLFADKRYKLLVILQGMDASGKDGTIRGVLGQVSPLGVHAYSWRAPTDEERAHDFLWRIHHRVPAAGELTIFNRSHYEDVLVPVVEGTLKREQTDQRFRQINDFERMLVETGTVVLKFMLLISRKEQGQRLQARIDDPAKAWKFVPHDLQVRRQWNAYRKAYEAFLGATSTDVAPWTIVPSDSKTHRNLMIGTIVRDTLKSMKLRYPPPAPEIATARVK
ncbi:PPK2 family polyphosphate kinase [Caenimonas soli]|uniref:PPK2 family polyphosphate kinase n=1 Tax=Caenimonas soli TaxID=2735555 RepID=UPI00155568B3|nr:PPK2 family polyphosphate kinase [Caenimonas soli]NPC54583.1 polyphosphate--nucleotide phosphotransferase [Caenimonas soli]